jgi:hypothetical protein
LARYSFSLFFLLQSVLFSQNYPDKFVDSLLTTGIDFIVEENYSDAEKVFTNLKNSNPNLPFGSLYLAATEIARSIDFFEEMNSEKVENLFEESEEIADSLYDEDEENIWHLYFEGLLAGYKAYYSALKGNYYDTFSDGYDSYSYFSQCLEQDTLFYEAYIAIGSFEYWMSAKTEFFSWIPFYEDNRANGISLLETAWKKAPYNSHLAAYSLIWIYINEKDYKKAIDLSEEELKKYPSTRFFKWGLANAYQYIDKKKSIEILNQIYDSYQTTGGNITTQKIVIKHKIAMLENKLGNYDSALKLCNEILDSCSKIERENSETEDRCFRAKELKRSILSKIK